MNRNIYLRAYMAGIAFPTAFLLILFCLSQFAFHAPDIMQRALMFPLALIPNAFGLWNVLFVKLPARHLSAEELAGYSQKAPVLLIQLEAKAKELAVLYGYLAPVNAFGALTTD